LIPADRHENFNQSSEAKMKSVLSHVALLVPSVKTAAAYLHKLGFVVGEAEHFEGEGTLEIYIGDFKTHGGTLLLMEPVREGAYTRAMKKRGPGLHHVAIDVPNLESFIEEISSSGWLLHPKSIKSIKELKTAYLCRPGIPTLMEVQERMPERELPGLVEKIKIPGLSERELQMFQSLGLQNIEKTTGDLSLVVLGQQISFAELIKT
jgi:hypothetical protein